jgi:hypothetical protein
VKDTHLSINCCSQRRIAWFNLSAVAVLQHSATARTNSRSTPQPAALSSHSFRRGASRPARRIIRPRHRRIQCFLQRQPPNVEKCRGMATNAIGKHTRTQCTSPVLAARCDPRWDCAKSTPRVTRSRCEHHSMATAKKHGGTSASSSRVVRAASTMFTPVDNAGHQPAPISESVRGARNHGRERIGRTAAFACAIRPAIPAKQVQSKPQTCDVSLVALRTSARFSLSACR